MTGNERQEANRAWLATAQAGDEVILTNSQDQVKNLLAGMFSGFGDPFGLYRKDNSPVEEVCELHTIHGHMKCDDPEHPEDLIIINLGGPTLRESHLKVYDRDGKECGVDNGVLSYNPVLVQPTDELRELSYKLKFIRDLKNVPFRSFSWEKIQELIGLINSEVNRLNDEHEAKKKEAEEDRMRKEEQTNSPSNTGGLISRALLADQQNFRDIQPVISHQRCPNCPNQEKSEVEVKEGEILGDDKIPE